MITVQWANSKWHASVSSGNFTACGIPVPRIGDEDIIFGFDDAVTCKRCLASIESQRKALEDLEIDRLHGRDK